MTTAAEKATGAETLAGMLVQAVGEHDGVAVTYKEGDDWRELSWEELGDTVRALAKGLIALGVEPGDRVAIFADTRPEWTYADFAVICAGAVAVPVYHTSSEEEAEHVLSDSSSKVAFLESEELFEKVREIEDELDDLEQVVLFEGSGENTLSLDELRERGEEVDDSRLDERVEGVEPSDLFTIIYTSGTTGPPKGCLLTHENYRKDCELLEQQVDMDEEAVVYVFLPLAHALTRITQMLAVDTGATIAYWQRDKDKLLEDLAEVRPTHFPAVPRIFEKIYTEAKSKAGGGLKGKALEKAVDVGRRYREAERAGDDPGFPLKQEFELADKQILSKVRDIFGGRLELALTGAAPVAEEMLEFFFACGVLVLEGYGATETSAVTAVNTPEDFKFGTVGKPLPGTELEIDESKGGDDEEESEDREEGVGEILVRGPHVFQGYHGLKDETDEVLDEDGWFHTEDLGSLDEDGFLKVTGREKDIIVTSSGKNITPTNIENKLTDHRWVGSAVAYGDDRQYLTALITIDEDERSALAKEAGVNDDPAEMAESDDVHAKIQEVVDDVNEDLAKIEQIKKFAILDRDLSADEGELTPTMKVKRNVVYEQHQELFDSLYDDESD